MFFSIDTIYPTPLLGQDMTQGQFLIFKRSLTGFFSIDEGHLTKTSFRIYSTGHLFIVVKAFVELGEKWWIFLCKYLYNSSATR